MRWNLINKLSSVKPNQRHNLAARNDLWIENTLSLCKEMNRPFIWIEIIVNSGYDFPIWVGLDIDSYCLCASLAPITVPWFTDFYFLAQTRIKLVVPLIFRFSFIRLIISINGMNHKKMMKLTIISTSMLKPHSFLTDSW